MAENNRTKVRGYYCIAPNYFEVEVPIEQLTDLRVGEIVDIPKDHVILHIVKYDDIKDERVRAHNWDRSRSVVEMAPRGNESMLITELID